MRYDKSSNTYRNKTGVKIRVPGFGETNTVEYSVKDTAVFVKKVKRKYMRNLVEHFAKCGYERGVSIRAAPYDWRLAAGTYLIDSKTNVLHKHSIHVAQQG